MEATLPQDTLFRNSLESLPYLNVGCGDKFSLQWTNIDIASQIPGVQSFDVSNGFPFQNGKFEVVYCSHLLEHIAPENVEFFIAECFRVLKSNGILRIAVPDLERIAKGYLNALDKASSGEAGWDQNYDWMMIELFDQTVRKKSGGRMKEFLEGKFENADFVFERIGYRRQTGLSDSSPSSKRTFLERAAHEMRRLRNIPKKVKKLFIKTILGSRDFALLEEAKFRHSGEIHQWMYDRFSLKRLLEGAGLKEITTYGPSESRIPQWNKFHLDTLSGGAAYKPDSIYIEAVKR